MMLINLILCLNKFFVIIILVSKGFCYFPKHDYGINFYFLKYYVLGILLSLTKSWELGMVLPDLSPILGQEGNPFDMSQGGGKGWFHCWGLVRTLN